MNGTPAGTGRDPAELHAEFDAVWANPPGWRVLSAVNHSSIALRFMVTGGVSGPQQNPSINQQSGGKWNMLLGSATNKAATGAAAKFQNQRPYTTAVMGRK